ncbi:hypothetical protein ABZ307_20145 [Streptomyces griseorubiginosus]|uniref:hypothetical protein n=1 Tax=Streptomyces griseorubiginosus TaxID=67304 RepID=UPI00339F9DDD
MTATHNSSQGPGSTNGGNANGGSGGSGDDTKIRKFEAMITILVGIIGGGIAGGAARKFNGASYFEAASTGVVATIVLAGFILGFLRYIKGQS